MTAAIVADYQIQSPETVARFGRIRQREVILKVQDLKKLSERTVGNGSFLTT